jgi:geranylgeranyl transferase type-1 subunit beta
VLTGLPTVGNPGSANIAATSFALLLLALLTDEENSDTAFSGVDRVRTLQWLRRLQRDDGSFGEVLVQVPEKGDKETYMVAGGRDMRYCYFAAMIRWMLRGKVEDGDPGWVEDYDVEGLVRHILRGQTYDGGVAESSQHEAHGK